MSETIKYIFKVSYRYLLTIGLIWFSASVTLFNIVSTVYLVFFCKAAVKKILDSN